MSIKNKPAKPRCFKTRDGRWFVIHRGDYMLSSFIPNSIIHIRVGAPMGSGWTPVEAIGRFVTDVKFRSRFSQ